MRKIVQRKIVQIATAVVRGSPVIYALADGGSLWDAWDLGRPDSDPWRWIPQSQIDDNSEIWEPGQEGSLVVSQWLAEQKGIG